MNTTQKVIGGILVILLLAGLGLAMWPAGVVRADSSLPGRDLGGLPDRDPPPDPKPERKHHHDTPLGAYIELSAPGHGGAASVVEWQDINGDWQAVEGWRANLDSAGYIRWWVAAKDFGTGPFHWVAGDAISPPFNLPAGAGEAMQVVGPAQP